MPVPWFQVHSDGDSGDAHGVAPVAVGVSVVVVDLQRKAKGSRMIYHALDGRRLDTDDIVAAGRPLADR